MQVTRRTAREWAIQMLTAADLNPPDDVQTFMNAYWDQISDLDEEDGGPTKAKGKLKAFAEDNDVIVRYEALKTHIRQRRERIALKYHFFRPFRSDLPLSQHLLQMQETLETRIRRK